jgi:hypothetical protein
MGKDNRSTLNRKMVELIKQSNIYLNHAPRHEKYALCQVVRNRLYFIYDLLTECEKRYHKKTTLTNLDIEHEKLRMDYLVYFEMGYFHYKNHKKELSQGEAYKRYECISNMVDEIGKMIGGWIKKNKEIEENQKSKKG